jgi:hypothetical protein
VYITSVWPKRAPIEGGGGGGAAGLESPHVRKVTLCGLNYVNHGTCSDICVYVNVVANSVMLQSCLWDEFYNIIFKISKLYVASGSDPPMERKVVGAPSHDPHLMPLTTDSNTELA